MSGLKTTIYCLLEKVWRNWQRYYKEIKNNDPFLLQNKYLEKIIFHSFYNVPYYQKLFTQIGLIKSNQIFWEKFQDIPPLTKKIIKENFQELISKDINKRKWYKNSSGGSTGIPQTFIQDNEYRNWALASQNFYFKKFLDVFPFEVKNITLWGSERDIFRQRKSLISLLAFYLRQEILLNTFKISGKDWLKYIEIINKEKPYYIKGYAGSLYQMAKLIDQKKLKIWQPKFIYSSAETLRPFMRKLIERVFKCKVYDFYGSREVGSIAGECKRGKIHIFNFNNFVEVVDEKNQPVKPGKMGKILITNLHNYSMPLIRYEIGDTAIWGEKCDCGINTPTLERITGRITDHFKNKKGDLIHGEYFTHLFYFRDWIKSFQVLQKKIDKIIIFFVADEEKKDEIKEIEEKIKLVMGEDCQIEWRKVKEILPTPQGKFLYTRSLIEND